MFFIGICLSISEILERKGAYKKLGGKEAHLSYSLPVHSGPYCHANTSTWREDHVTAHLYSIYLEMEEQKPSRLGATSSLTDVDESLSFLTYVARNDLVFISIRY